MISIIVPVYKAEKSLSFCIESILKQTYSDYELILVDDGSPDQSGIICDIYAGQDDRIKVIHKSNGGVSSARNAGIKVAIGEYMIFCDSDDYLEKDYLAVFINTAHKYPGFDHIWCLYKEVSDYNSVDNDCTVDSIQTEVFSLRSFMSLNNRALAGQPWNKLYRSSIIKERQLLFLEGLSLGEDLLFNLAYIDSSTTETILMIDAPLYNYYRNNNTSLSNKYRPDLLEIYHYLNRQLKEFLLRKDIFKENEKQYYNSVFYSFLDVFNNNLLDPNSKRKEVIKRNNRILRSDSFKEVFKQRNCFIHPLYYMAYQFGEYRYVIALDIACNIKNKFWVKH